MNYDISDCGSSYEIMARVFTAYAYEFGERKFNEVCSKIESSKKVASLLEASMIQRKPVGGLGFLSRVNEIPYFFFSRGQTQLVATLLVIRMWDRQVNARLNLCSANEIYADCRYVYHESMRTFG